jgi:hypothetical protein
VLLCIVGRLDSHACEALHDAVHAATEVSGDVVVELDAATGLGSDVVRVLAACAHLGAQVRFAGGRPSRASA